MSTACAEPAAVIGYFDWEPFYDRIVDTAPPDAVLVELGVFCGKSLIYLAKRAMEQRPDLRIYGVDTFQGSEEFNGTVFVNNRPWDEVPPGFLVSMCMDNLTRAGVRDFVTVIVSDSAKAARLFADESVHMVFVDAAHDRDSVSQDLSAWTSKMKPGGVLAGHDYHEAAFPGVKEAVDAAFGERVETPGQWWEVAIRE